MHKSALWLLILGLFILLIVTLICFYVMISVITKFKNSATKTLNTARSEIVGATILVTFSLFALAGFTWYVFSHRKDCKSHIMIPIMIGLIVLLPLLIATGLYFLAASNIASSATGDYSDILSWLTTIKIFIILASVVILISSIPLIMKGDLNISRSLRKTIDLEPYIATTTTDTEIYE